MPSLNWSAYDSRLTALNCFSDLLLRPIDEDLLSKSIKEFLPGVSTHLMKIVNGEVKQPHSITRVLYQILIFLVLFKLAETLISLWTEES